MTLLSGAGPNPPFFFFFLKATNRWLCTLFWRELLAHLSGFMPPASDQSTSYRRKKAGWLSGDHVGGPEGLSQSWIGTFLKYVGLSVKSHATVQAWRYPQGQRGSHSRHRMSPGSCYCSHWTVDSLCRAEGPRNICFCHWFRSICMLVREMKTCRAKAVRS